MKKDKNAEIISDKNSFAQSWTLKNAMYVLQHPTVDSKLWAEAVEWLIIHGPAEIQDILLSASMYATKSQFPDIETIGCTADGEPCYDLSKIADSLQIDVEEAERILKEKEKSHGIRHGFSDDETSTLQ